MIIKHKEKSPFTFAKTKYQTYPPATQLKKMKKKYLKENVRLSSKENSKKKKKERKLLLPRKAQSTISIQMHAHLRRVTPSPKPTFFLHVPSLILCDIFLLNFFKYL